MNIIYAYRIKFCFLPYSSYFMDSRLKIDYSELDYVLSTLNLIFRAPKKVYVDKVIYQDLKLRIVR